MLNISQIYLESATSVYADFFESSLHLDRLSTMGHWQGRGAKILGLKNPVQLKDLENLLNGLTPDGGRSLVADARAPKRIAGWRVILDAAPLLNDFWAVAPREAQVRIERGFVQAVNRGLRCFEDVVTGVGTLVPRPDSQKAVMAVFRTNAAWDLSAQLQATAVLMNVGLKSPNSAETFRPSEVMALESGLRDFFERALVAQLSVQISQVESRASKRLKLDEVVKAMSQKLAMDSYSRETWARRDDRGIHNQEKKTRVANWQNTAKGIGSIAEWEEFKRIVGMPGQVFDRMMKEFWSGRQVNEHAAHESADSSKHETKNAETKRQTSTVRRSIRQTFGHSY